MAKVKKAFFCKNCGFEAPKWLGRCPSCGEWNTFAEEIIARALADGKRVAVPRCVPGTRVMDFYLIESRDDLEPGAFGILEPRPSPERLLSD